MPVTTIHTRVIIAVFLEDEGVKSGGSGHKVSSDLRVYTPLVVPWGFPLIKYLREVREGKRERGGVARKRAREG